LYTARIIDSNPHACTVQVEATEENFEQRNFRIEIALAPTKNIDRTEWFLEKATEIGLDWFIPIESEHSERRTINTERCTRVVVSAMKQSIKTLMPQIDPLTKFAELVSQPFEGDKFIAHCQDSEEKILLRDAVTPARDTLILIGPEGDFSPAEIELAHKFGFKDISLGKARLRTETAGLAACHTVALINQ
jgi:16S rRNA (uracil1498-N3)-methyltransferase